MPDLPYGVASEYNLEEGRLNTEKITTIRQLE